MPNGINNISPSIRDFLLNRNLILSDTVSNNGLSGYGVGLGLPVTISTYPETVIASSDIEIEGQSYRDLNLLNNPYASTVGDIVVDINSNNIQNIGNLPIGTPQSEYTNYIGSRIIDSSFTNYGNDGRVNLLRNLYQPSESERYLVSLDNSNNNVENSNGGYLDRNGNLNIGGPSTKAINIIGGILNGGGIGIGGDSNFDIRSSLAGRVLNGIGVLNDTKLGVIGGRELLKSLANKVSFNAQREILGNFNLNPLSLLSGNDFLVPNYSITVGKDKVSKILDIGLNILGFEAPKGYLFEDSSSIFYVENKVDTKDRLLSQVSNTGKGQIISLFKNLNENTYKMQITDSRFKGESVISNLYLFNSGNGAMLNMLNAPLLLDDKGKVLGSLKNGPNTPISPSNYKLESMVRDGEFSSLKGLKIGEEGFTWAQGVKEELFHYVLGDGVNLTPVNSSSSFEAYGDVNINKIKRGLLNTTKNLFKSGHINVMVSSRGLRLDTEGEIDNGVKVFRGFKGDKMDGPSFISRGSGVKSLSALEGVADDANMVFCRSWTSLVKYDKVRNLQKSDGLKSNYGLRNRNTVSKSVLDDNGFVRVAPTRTKGEIENNTELDAKRFMFSIENLAWAGQTGNLPKNEIGPGDPLTKTKGRIMWFPPYDIKFTESTSLKWDSYDFIGRGEPMYTYNNSERSGSLSFKVIIDHASYMNDITLIAKESGYDTDDFFNSIVAGCTDFGDYDLKNISENDQNALDVDNASKVAEKQDTPSIVPLGFSYYFPNDVVSDAYFDYERFGSENGEVTASSYGKIPEDPGYTKGQTIFYEDRSDFGLNKAYYDTNFFTKLSEDFKKCEHCKIVIKGYASKDGVTSVNKRLSDDRAKTMKGILIKELLGGNETSDPLSGNRFKLVVGKGESTDSPSKGVKAVDSILNKKARRVDVTFVDDPSNKKMLNEFKTNLKSNNLKKILNDRVKGKFFNESLYFEKLRQDDKFTYDSISEKIKFFHPAFHSVTPEGFNSRLTFLNQCTRQGPTKNANSPSNLVFGAAPVSILRIGDFYHTKIIIDSLNIDYDGGFGTQWDLNPEGVGVQPMIANVSISFKFIGGQSLDGPINKLQNAVSFNYFANTEIYDSRAEYFSNGRYTSDVVKFKPEAGSPKPSETKVGIELNEVEVFGTFSAPSTETAVDDGKIKITGFKYIEVRETLTPNKRSFMFSLKFLNLPINLGESSVSEFVSKGLKIRLSNNNSFTHEEIVSEISGASGSSGCKSFSCLNDNYILGDRDSGTISLVNGNYNLAIIHDGKTIQTIPVKISSELYKEWF